MQAWNGAEVSNPEYILEDLDDSHVSTTMSGGNGGSEEEMRQEDEKRKGQPHSAIETVSRESDENQGRWGYRHSFFNALRGSKIPDIESQ